MMSILFMLLNLKIRYGILISTPNSFGNALGISYDFSNLFNKYSKTRIIDCVILKLLDID